ncbi:hypothetical protein OAE31_04035 [Gammaproteobacteria bacterium]|nr:hypothetical protein [Gammaproteobacteria bacterium]
MGSGSSINDITHEQFKLIKKNFSIGINSWFIHDFITDIYMFEAGNESWSQASKIFEYLDRDHKNFIQRPILIPYDSFWFDNEIKKLKNNKKLKILYYFVLPFFITKSMFLSKAFKNQSRISKFMNLNSSIYGSGSSIIRAVCLAEELGYKEIILCGVDLNNTDYFYEIEDRHLLNKGIEDFISNQEGNVHLTNDPTKKKIILEDFLKYVKEDSHFNSKIYIASKKSSLYPMLNLYDWDDN